jgi:hypothetical protein
VKVQRSMETPPWDPSYNLIMSFAEPFINAFLQSFVQEVPERGRWRSILERVDCSVFATNLIVFLRTFITEEDLPSRPNDHANMTEVCSWFRVLILELIYEVQNEPTIRKLWKHVKERYEEWKIKRDELLERRLLSTPPDLD